MNARIRQTAVATLLFLLAITGAQASSQHQNSALKGVWQITITPDDPNLPPVFNYVTITKDGKVVNVDPGFGAGVGDSYRVGPREYAVGFFGFVEMNGMTMTYEVQGTAMRTAPGQFSGPYRTLIRDLAGNLLNEVTGTIEGSRLPVQPF